MTTHATPKPVLLDVDTGIDDAMAIAAAVRCPTLEVVAITTVAGNVAVPLTTDNTLRVLSLLGRDDIPVHRGMAGPLVRDLRHAAHFHGENGLGGFEPPAPRRGVRPTSAPEAII
ncbi:MAG: nucleoside hydrolase, partial [Thermomicrobiaceae bacterium]|nr:nucleoside hydrolase [Thermomicrobiaceae bacterium]